MFRMGQSVKRMKIGGVATLRLTQLVMSKLSLEFTSLKLIFALIAVGLFAN